MKFFPTTIEDLKKVYKDFEDDMSVMRWEVSCSPEDNNSILSELLKNNALSVALDKGTVYLTVSRFGVDVGSKEFVDSYKHSKYFYANNISDLKEHWKSFSGTWMKWLGLTIFDRTGKPLYSWHFEKAYLTSPQEIVFDFNNNSNSKESQRLLIPIHIQPNQIIGCDMRGMDTQKLSMSMKS